MISVYYLTAELCHGEESAEYIVSSQQGCTTVCVLFASCPYHKVVPYYIALILPVSASGLPSRSRWLRYISGGRTERATLAFEKLFVAKIMLKSNLRHQN